MYHSHSEVKLSLVAQLSAVVDLSGSKQSPVGDDVSGKQLGDMVEVQHSALPQIHPTDLIFLHLRVKGYSEKSFPAHPHVFLIIFGVLKGTQLVSWISRARLL
jgi:hypothetical protein